MIADQRRERLDRGIKARSDDIYALASVRDLAYLVGPRAVLIGGLLALPLLGGIAGRYWLTVELTTFTIALMALSWDLLASVGLLSLGQSVFFGAGGYIAGVLNSALRLPPVLTITAGTFLGALACALAFIPVLRLRGIYFALITLTLPLLLQRVIEATKILGGTEGLSSLDPLPDLVLTLYVVIAALLASFFGFRRLADSDFGVVLRGIQNNDRSVIAAGIDVQWYKTVVVFVAGLPAAFAGAVMAHQFQFVGMPAFALDYSVLPLTSAIVGGIGTYAGPIIGAFLLVPLSEILRGFGTWRVVLDALVLLVFVIGMREGIFRFLRRRYYQFERRVAMETRP